MILSAKHMMIFADGSSIKKDMLFLDENSSFSFNRDTAKEIQVNNI